MAGTVPFSGQDPDSADNPISRLLPDSAMSPESFANKNPSSAPRHVKGSGLIRTWLATSTDLRPTGELTHIEWGIHWYTPVSIVLLVLLGTATAITHHIHYNTLHDAPVGDAFQQGWNLWIGSALGFLTKVTLTAALGISRTQWVWLTLRKKWFTLRAIDSLFGIISDPTLFLDWRMMRKAKVATVMAIAMWMFPLAAILTPGTISVETVARSDTVPCVVPSLLFEFDHLSNATTPDWGKTVTVLNFWTWDIKEKVIRRSVRYIPAFRLTAYTGTITRLATLAEVDPSGLTTLGQQCGANCTYTVKFLGPAMTCAEFTAWEKTKWANSTVYMDSKLLQAVDNPVAQGSFLVGLKLKNHPRVVFECKSSAAHYTVQHMVQDRLFREPIITEVETVDLPNLEPFPVFPNSAYLPNYGLYRTIYSIMMGDLGGRYGGDSESANTMLMSDIFGNPSNVGKAIELLSHRMIVSMIAFDHVFNSRKHVLNIAAIQKTQCSRTKSIPVYVYSPQTLLIVYGLAVAIALATSVAGFIALGHNGMASTKNVSTIIRTTRNRTLDECIVGGDCLGGDVMSPELTKLELRFGALKTDKLRTAPFALGVEGEIYPIKRD